MQRSIWTFVAILFVASLVGGQESAAGGFGKEVTSFVGTPIAGSAIDSKLDPGMRYMIRQYESALQQEAGAQRDAAMEALFDGSHFFRLGRSESGSPKAHAMFKLSNPSLAYELERLGVEITTVVDDIVLGQIPVDAAYSVASLDNIQSMQISSYSKPYLNLSRVEAKVDAVHTGSGGLPMSYKGAGVISGTVDSGIDWSHPDFSVSANNTRIQFILDYGNAGQSGPPTEWTKAQIDAGQCTQIDGQGSGGHGTHVAGTSAGGGRRNGAYIGMAPESDIVFVKGIRDPNSNGGFSDNDVIAGVQFIFNKATSMNKPAVANLSLGGHFGPHDGSSLYEQALSNLVRPGRIIVAAAGNEGNDFIHVSYPVQGTNYQTALESFMFLNQNASIAAADMWYPSTGNISVGLAVYQPGNINPLAVTNPVPVGQKIENALLTTTGGTPLGVVTIDATTAADPNNNSRRAVFVISDNNGQIAIDNFVWSMYTFGSGTFDMWAVVGGSFPQAGGLPTFARQGDNNKSVGMPSTAKKVICVGSYVSKTTWIDINNTTQTQPGATLGAISGFSSRGPSRDARIKPDIAAPGEAILAAHSSSVTAPPSTILQGGGLLKLQGTSMASPHVAGIAALMLQRNRHLNHENIVNLLSSTATPAGGTVPNNTFGGGKVNALNAMLATPNGVDCATLAKLTGFDCDGNKLYSYELLDAYPNPFNPATTIPFRLEKQEKTHLAVYDMLGRLVKTLVNEEHSAGLHNVVWDGTDSQGKAVSSGVYFSRLTTPGFTASNRLVMVK